MTDVIAMLAQELADLQTLYEADQAAFASQIAMQHELRDAMEAERDGAYENLKEARTDWSDMEEDIKDAWRALGYLSDPPDRDVKSLADAIDEALPDEEETRDLASAADALRDHLVSLGYPSDPASKAALPPSLRALAEVLL